jgi:hypothetical protein
MSDRNLFGIAICVSAMVFSQVNVASQQSGSNVSHAQQNEGWSAPLQVSRTASKSWFADVVADTTGRVHIVWAGHDNGYDTVYYRSLLPDQRWSSQTDIFAESVFERRLQEATRPAIALDIASNLLMTNRVLDIYFSKVHASLADNVAAWSDPQAISTVDTSYFSRIAVDSQNTIHAFITQNVPTPSCQICMHLFYRNSKDGGNRWSPAQDISIAANGVVKPQVVIDGQDNLHVIWEAGVSGGTLGQVMPPTSVYYASSQDNGSTWGDPIALGLGSMSEQYRSPAISIDGKGRLVAVWLKMPEDAVYYQISQDNGFNWSSPIKIPELYGSTALRDNRLDSFSMATDGVGNVHLVVVGRIMPDQNQLGVYHTTWNGESWSVPQTIQPPSVNLPSWPRIAVSLGNRLHVVYTLNSSANMGLSEGDEGVRLDIMHAQSQIPVASSSSMGVPVPYPTLTPVPTPTPAPQALIVEPTSPVFLDRSPSAVDAQNLRTEVDDYSMLLLSGVPVVLLFAVALFIIRRRRA